MRSRMRRRLIAGTVTAASLAALLTVAVTRASDDRTDRTGTVVAGDATTAKVRDGGARVGDAGPAVSAVALDGRKVTLPGTRPTVVFFFAGWCGTCVPEAAALAEVHRRHGADVDIVAVDVDPGDTPDTIRQFLAAAGNPAYPVVHDVSGALSEAFEVSALDTTVIIDRSGNIVYRDSVPSTAAQLREGFAKAGVTL